MVFKRRKKRTTLKNLKELFMPENGWRRTLEYLSYRIKRLPDTPHRIALGLSCGVFATFTPLFGIHILVGALLAFLFRANILASILGTFFGNPVTFPFIAAICVRLGNFILDRASDSLNESIAIDNWMQETDLTSFEVIEQFLLEVYSDKFIPYALGGVICGLLMAVIVYVLSKPLIITYQRRKSRKKKKQSIGH